MPSGLGNRPAVQGMASFSATRHALPYTLPGAGRRAGCRPGPAQARKASAQMASEAARAEPAGETDADLLLFMALRADDPPGARAAWEEFYARHVRYLYAVCLRAYADLLGGPAGVGDLVADTFRRAYEHAGTFDAAGLDDPDRLRRRARAWLGRIAQRLVQTALRGRAKLPTVRLEPDHWQLIAGRDELPPAGDPQRVERVREAIASLSPREQAVLRVTFQWYRPDRSHQRLPNDVAAELAESLATTPENLRQIRRRAMRKVEAILRQFAGCEAPRSRKP